MSKKIINLLVAVAITLSAMGCNSTPKATEADMQSAEINNNFARNEYAAPNDESTMLAPISEPDTN